jgi:hypothetical protein
MQLHPLFWTGLVMCCFPEKGEVWRQMTGGPPSLLKNQCVRHFTVLAGLALPS